MLELLSIHIPKTAGRSFYEVLSQVYGSALDERQSRKDFLPDVLRKHLDDNLPGKIRVIHGHLTVSQIDKVREKFQPKVVTWIRNPVDRVISNYYFLMKRIREGNVAQKQIKKRDFSLIQYASQPPRLNRMTEILKGMDIEDFFFIGIFEQFEKDIQELATKLKWPDIEAIPRINDSSFFKRNNDCKTQFEDIDEVMREEIARLNKKDIKLYEDVKKMRGII
jgi:hypothetical protein